MNKIHFGSKKYHLFPPAAMEKTFLPATINEVGINMITPSILKNRSKYTLTQSCALLLAVGVMDGSAFAGEHYPTEHKGLQVEQLGVVPAESMARQVGLDGHILLLRRITIEPGGQIAHHSAAKVPGIVYMETGEWTEGREEGEIVHSAGDTFIEDADTVHWFYNRGDEPATALVFDIKPAN